MCIDWSDLWHTNGKLEPLAKIHSGRAVKPRMSAASSFNKPKCGKSRMVFNQFHAGLQRQCRQMKHAGTVGGLIKQGAGKTLTAMIQCDGQFANMKCVRLRGQKHAGNGRSSGHPDFTGYGLARNGCGCQGKHRRWRVNKAIHIGEFSLNKPQNRSPVIRGQSAIKGRSGCHPAAVSRPLSVVKEKDAQWSSGLSAPNRKQPTHLPDFEVLTQHLGEIGTHFARSWGSCVDIRHL